jgi:hypothetical protein
MWYAHVMVGGIHVSTYSPFIYTKVLGRVEVGNAKKVNIKCTSDLGDSSELVLRPNKQIRPATVNDARGDVRLDHVTGVGSIKCSLDSQLLPG